MGKEKVLYNYLCIIIAKELNDIAFLSLHSLGSNLFYEIGFRQHGSQTFGLQTEIGFANAVHKPKGL